MASAPQLAATVAFLVNFDCVTVLTARAGALPSCRLARSVARAGRHRELPPLPSASEGPSWESTGFDCEAQADADTQQNANETECSEIIQLPALSTILILGDSTRVLRMTLSRATNCL